MSLCLNLPEMIPMSLDKQAVFIFGASGHAKSVIDVIERQELYRIVSIFDDNAARHGQPFFGYMVEGGRDSLLRAYDEKNASACIVAIGDNSIRSAIVSWLTENGIARVTAIHPTAQLGRGAVIGQGSVMMAGSIVNPDAIVGADVIINTGASVDHDCVIGDGVHISPGCRLCGHVKVGNGTFIGVGSMVIPGVTIGSNVVIGAGSVVLQDIPSGKRVAGVPCRDIA